MRIDPDLVAMAIMAAVLILPGAGVSMYRRAKARWAPPSSTGAASQAATAAPLDESRIGVRGKGRRR